MTSTATPQNSTQATNTAAPSYASAASASKKPAAGPNTLVASGSHPAPVVVGSSATSNAKPASASPANGRPTIPPAVPVVHGSSAVNGGAADHARKPSVTISANGPPSYGANGGPVGGPKNIQFGFRDSPVVSHSTPQLGASSPIPIPGSGNPRVASPAQSPSPIPQPAASGGRPPAGLQSGDVKPSFGSFNNDPEVSYYIFAPPYFAFSLPLSVSPVSPNQKKQSVYRHVHVLSSHKRACLVGHAD